MAERYDVIVEGQLSTTTRMVAAARATGFMPAVRRIEVGVPLALAVLDSVWAEASAELIDRVSLECAAALPEPSREGSGRHVLGRPTEGPPISGSRQVVLAPIWPAGVDEGEIAAEDRQHPLWRGTAELHLELGDDGLPGAAVAAGPILLTVHRASATGKIVKTRRRTGSITMAVRPAPDSIVMAETDGIVRFNGLVDAESCPSHPRLVFANWFAECSSVRVLALDEIGQVVKRTVDRGLVLNVGSLLEALGAASLEEDGQDPELMWEGLVPALDGWPDLTVSAAADFQGVTPDGSG